MDMPVNYNVKTENDSIWSVVKTFFSNSKNKDEEMEIKIAEIEKQQDNLYIKRLCKFVSAPEIKSNNVKNKAKSVIKKDSSRTNDVLEVEPKTLEANIRHKQNVIDEQQEEIGK